MRWLICSCLLLACGGSTVDGLPNQIAFDAVDVVARDDNEGAGGVVIAISNVKLKCIKAGLFWQLGLEDESQKATTIAGTVDLTREPSYSRFELWIDTQGYVPDAGEVRLTDYEKGMRAAGEFRMHFDDFVLNPNTDPMSLGRVDLNGQFDARFCD